MGIDETIQDLKAKAGDFVENAKAALDADADGSIEASEVIDALTGRAKETAEAAGAAVEEVKKGLDANADGEVTLDEVRATGEAVVEKVKDAAEGLMGKAAGDDA